MSYSSFEDDLGANAPFPLNVLCLGLLFAMCCFAWIFSKISRFAAISFIFALGLIAVSGCVAPAVEKHVECSEWSAQGSGIECRRCREYIECRRPVE